jgi:phage terminase large subunit
LPTGQCVAGVIHEAQVIKEWSHNILKYLHDTLPEFIPTKQQEKALLLFQAMVWAKIKCNKNLAPTDYERELSRKFGVSIMSGVGTGKGAFASACILWFMTCFPFPKIVVTAKSQKQLSITLWSELAKWHQRSKLKDWFVHNSEKFFLREQEGKQWFASQRTANVANTADEQAETLAGLHEDFLLIIADEASGIPDPVFRPLESTLTRMCNLCLLTFNPTRSRGFAYDTHNRDADNWETIHWSAEESDNVSRESIERYAKKYGRDSNFFKIRVLGIPPSDADQTVIPWDWIQNAIDRELECLEDTPTVCSLDVGAGGDDSVLGTRTGPILYPLQPASFQHSNMLVDWVMPRIIQAEPKIVLVDNIGVGWGIAGSLREKLRKHDIDVQEVDVSQAAFRSEKFPRLRDELWWRLREEFEKGIISIPDDALLHGDLNAPRYEEMAGKIKVETKKDMKKRGVDSPNRADSLMMTEIYDPATVRQIYIPLHKRAKQKARKGNWKTA